MQFKDRLERKSAFVIIVELTSGKDFNLNPIEGFLEAYRKAKPDFLPGGFDFVGITCTENSSGIPKIEPVSVLSHIKSKGLLGDLDFIPHISCKDKNSDALVSTLAGFKAMDVEALLVVTGDKPLKGKGVFELDSINLLQLIRQENWNEYLKSSPEELDGVHQFFPGAAVSPFKYTEASQMQQYYKMEKKIACGAQFIITQVGWDWKKSVELFRYLRENNVDIPIIGNAFLLSTNNPSPRLMRDLKLPGCYVSEEFFEKLSSENYDEQIERCAQQVAMYKSIGAAGVDIGSVHDFDVFTRIINRASEIGENWERYKENLYWPKKDGFYLYDDSGNRTDQSKPRQKFKHKFFNFFHKHLFESKSVGFRAFGKMMAGLGAKKNTGFVYNSFSAFEYAFKHALFECDMCGDCYLPENFSLCTIGGCEKSLSNSPCGDATVDGLCGNNLDIVCIGERIYNAAASLPGGIEKLRMIVNEPRIHSLEQTSSILNDWFGRDHNAKPAFVSIGDMIHSSVPKIRKIMQQLQESNADIYSKKCGVLTLMRSMIESQAAAGADYIAVNLDALSRNNPSQHIDTMANYLLMIQKWGCSVPVCIDSDNTKVLIEGLKKWYETGNGVRPPLLSSLKQNMMDEVLAMRKEYDFGIVVSLQDSEQNNDKNGNERVENLYLSARKIFDKLINYGFKPEEVFFEMEVCPLDSDLQQNDGIAAGMYITFETAKKIKNDRKMSGVHRVLCPSKACRKLRRSIGITRAYLDRALRYGFDTAFVNVTLQFGKVEPDVELLKLVDAFAKMDGSPERKEVAANQIRDFVKD